MKKVCLAGCGRLGHVIADGLMAGKVPGAELTAVLVQTAEKLQAELGCLVTTDLIVLSTSIFGESAFYDQARAAATRYGRQIHLAHGVIGGLDVVETAAMMGEVTAGLTKRKFSKGSARSDAALDALADEFHATAAEAMEQYPDQLNVAISLALAAGNLERTEVHVSPAEMVDFTIRCDGIFGEAAFYTRLGDSGPDLAAWSALAMLRRLTSPIVF